MSEPSKEKTVRAVVMELIGAKSSLNMLPDPIKEPGEDARYLSELDSWAAHSMEHMTAAYEAAVEIERELERLYQSLLEGGETDVFETLGKLLGKGVWRE